MLAVCGIASSPAQQEHGKRAVAMCMHPTRRVLYIAAGQVVDELDARDGSHVSRIMSDLPTVSESGLQGFEIASWSGVMAPAGTPRDIVSRLHRAIAAGMHAADLQSVLDEMGYEPSGNTPEQFAAMIRDEYAKFARVVREAGITAEP